MNTLEQIENWFKQAKPNPTVEDACTQVGVHAEEFGEMLLSINEHEASKYIDNIADAYKKYPDVFLIENQGDLLDSLCDQIVTAIGVGYMMGYDIQGALKEVANSNDSKFTEGKPIFNDQGKIMKGENYFKPQLEQFLNKKGE